MSKEDRMKVMAGDCIQMVDFIINLYADEKLTLRDMHKHCKTKVRFLATCINKGIISDREELNARRVMARHSTLLTSTVETLVRLEA